VQDLWEIPPSSSRDLHDTCSAFKIRSTIWLFQKNLLNDRFISDWLRFSENAQLITDAPSIAPNHASFVENRHDQSIFGLLVIKYNLGVVLKDQTWPRENSRK
jgi:hypothetical protein